MPSRRRRTPGGPPPAAPESAAELFARRQAEARQAQRDADRARAAARKVEAEHQRLIAEKDAAASRLKRARQSGASGAARQEADAAYRAALEALLAHERGDPPPSEATNEGTGQPDDAPEVSPSEETAAGPDEDEPAAP